MPDRVLSNTSPFKIQVLKWKRRRDIPLAILAWIALIAIILWAASHVIRAILIFAIAALLAYALSPLVKPLQRFMPRPVAIFIVYLLSLSLICFFFYQAARNAIEQSAGLTKEIPTLLSNGPNGSLTRVTQVLAPLGITSQQIVAARQQFITWGEEVLRSSVPFLRSALDFAIDAIVVAVVSIYLLLDGPRAVRWIRENAPPVTRANFILDVLQSVVGGYIRGQITLALLIGILVGLGMGLIFHLPFAVFLGAVAFIMAFIPVVGTFVSGAICVLIGLTHGWLVAVGVLIYFIFIHVIEGEVVGPRIVGHAIGLHPIVSLLALIAGAELFGIWGALFASPVAGVLQALIISTWQEWKATHPEHFQKTQSTTEEEVEKSEQPP
jgi:predicted PurR-regulated permease PerM